MAERVLGFTIEVGGTETEIQKTGNLKRELIDLSKEIKQLKDATKGNTGAQKASAENLGKLEAQQKAVRSEINKNQKATINQIKANNSAAGSYDRLAAETRNLRQRLRALPEGFDKSNEAARGLTKQIASNEQKLKDFDSAIGQNFRNVGNYRDVISSTSQELLNVAGAQGNLTGIVSSFGPAAIAAFAVGAIVAFGKQLNDVVDEFVILRGEANKITGAVGSALDSIVAKARSTATVFDKDFNEIVRTANVLAKQMDIGFDEAFELINKGFLAGADSGGDFLNQVQEFSTQFDDAGASAEELIAIITQQTTEGIFSDKGVDTVKEFGLRIREQTTGTREALENAFGKEFSDRILNGINDASLSSIEALKLVSGELKNTEIPAAELQTVIADVFGGPGEDAGLKFLQNLENIETELDNLIDPTNTLVQIQQKQLRLQEELAGAQNRFSAALDTGTTSFSNFGTIIKTEVFNALGDFVLKVQTAIAIIKSIGDLEIFGGEGFKKSLESRIEILNASNEEQIKIQEELSEEELAIARKAAEDKKKLTAEQLAAARKAAEGRRKIAIAEAEFLRKLDGQIRIAIVAEGKDIGKQFVEAFAEGTEAGFELIGDELLGNIEDLFGEDAIEGEELTEALQERFLASSEGRIAVINAELEARIILQEEHSERLKEIDDELLARQLESVSAFQEGSTRVLGAIGDFSEARFAKESALLQSQQDEQLKALADSQKAELKTFQGTAVQKAKLQERFGEEATALQEKLDDEASRQNRAFRKEQAVLASLTTIVNGAAAIISALATVVPTVPAGVAAAALVGIETIAQLAIINSQQFARGGRLVGTTHARGGIPFTVDGVPGFEAQHDEAVVNANTMKDPYLSSMVSWANMQGGGVALTAERGMMLPRKYQGGGLFPTPSPLISPTAPAGAAFDIGLEEFAAQIVNGINDKRVIAVESDQRAAADRVIFAEELTQF